jgi:hypothetical protein
MFDVMFRSMQNPMRTLPRLVLVAVLLEPFAVSAADMAMAGHGTVAGTSSATAEGSASDGCCEHVKNTVPPCDDPSLCAIKCAGPQQAYSTGQGTNGGCSRTYRPGIPHAREQPSTGRMQLSAAGPPLSILFCSFQN